MDRPTSLVAPEQVVAELALELYAMAQGPQPIEDAVAAIAKRLASFKAAPVAPLLLQDENSGREGRRYNEWHASRPDARLNAREAAAAMEGDKDAKTWAAYVAGIVETYLNGSPSPEVREKAIAGIIERRLWALPTAATPAAPSEGVTSDGDCMRLAVQAGAVVPPGYTPAPPVFPSWSAWGRFCDSIRAALAQPAPVQAGAQQAAPSDMEFALAALHAIAGNEEVVDGCIEKIVDIRRARPRAAEAYRRLARCEKVWASALAAPTQAGAGDAVDAQRYRWLREEAQYFPAGRAPAVVLCDEHDLMEKGRTPGDWGFISGKKLDAAIDAALKGASPSEGDAA